MQSLVPIDTIPQILNLIKEVGSKPQFKQIKRLVHGILLVKGQGTPEAIRQSLVEPISKGSFNRFLAESVWSERTVQQEVLTMLESNRYTASPTSEIVFADDTLTGEHYRQQIEGLTKYRDVTQPGLSYIYSHCLVNLHYAHQLTRAECRQSGQCQP